MPTARQMIADQGRGAESQEPAYDNGPSGPDRDGGGPSGAEPGRGAANPLTGEQAQAPAPPSDGPDEPDYGDNQGGAGSAGGEPGGGGGARDSLGTKAQNLRNAASTVGQALGKGGGTGAKAPGARGGPAGPSGKGGQGEKPGGGKPGGGNARGGSDGSPNAGGEKALGRTDSAALKAAGSKGGQAALKAAGDAAGGWGTLAAKAASELNKANQDPSHPLHKTLRRVGRVRKVTRWLPLLIPLAAAAMVIVLLVGILALFGDDVTQPSKESDALVAKYFPSDWEDVLKDAATQASDDASSYAAVPWTILAGLAEAQTDFGRYSPYDNVDRDPGRKSATIPTPGDGGGGNTQVGFDGSPGGAGPGPVTGVTGPGSTRSLGAGHPGPPAGDLSHQLGWFLYALRMHESNGNYTAQAKGSDACGAYQYISSTWNNYGGYATACQAPPSIQDKRETQDTINQFRSYGTWQQVTMTHFFPDWAASPSEWNACPAACGANPTGWGYVDDVMNKMRQAAAQHPATGGAHPAGFHIGPGATDGGATDGGNVSDGVFADGCAIEPTKPIGGKGKQGVGPYLLTPAAAGEMKDRGLDPQSPCDSSEFVAEQLVHAAEQVHDDPQAPKLTPNGGKGDQANARKYWTQVIETSGIFVDRSANPDAPCSVPPPADPKKPRSVSYKVISIWRCEVNRVPDVYLVTDTRPDDHGGYSYSVDADRTDATDTLINEAMSVSYGGSKWKTEGCDPKSAKRQGIFPMTKKEAAAAGLPNRCNVDANIDAAAKLVLSVEKTPPEQRDKSLGPYQPMIGGWQRLSIAMGTQAKEFAQVGPNPKFSPTKACNAAIDTYLHKIAPYAKQFAKLTDPPSRKAFPAWSAKLSAVQNAHGVTEPEFDPSCYQAGSVGDGFPATVAQAAAGMADHYKYAKNLNGLSQYYLGKEDAETAPAPVAGKQTLVAPRLAPSPLKPIEAPVSSDATDAWSDMGSSDGVTLPVSEVAVDYAWFFGGVVAPFNTAGQRIGSLASGGGSGSDPGMSQVTVGPNGCPRNVPSPNDLRAGAENYKGGIYKLCADSVREAHSPQAAKAIKWELTHLNIPYSQPERNAPGAADCSSFASRAYRDSGAVPNLYPKGTNAPTTVTLPTLPQFHKIDPNMAKPGDLIEPNPGHVFMKLTGNYIVHTNRTGDVSHVEAITAYPRPYFWAGQFANSPA